MVQGQVFLKWRGGGGGGGGKGVCHFSYLIISFFHSEITLPFPKLCYACEEKKIFCHHNFMKKISFKVI